MAETKISAAALTTPAVTDLIPFARPADTIARHMTVSGLMSVSGYGSNTLLASSSLIGATNITVDYIPAGMLINPGWVVIDAYTVQCEVRKAGNISGNTVTWMDGLSYAHSAGDIILWIDAPILNVRWFGAVGNGNIDDTAAIQAAITTAPDGSTVYIPAGTYIISSCLEILDKNDFDILGDGIGKSILDASGSPTLTYSTWLQSEPYPGVIICDANNVDDVLENIFIRHIELKCNPSANNKGILMCTIRNFGCEYVKLDGPKYEGFDAIDYWSGGTKRHKHFIIRHCEVVNGGTSSNVVNINSTGLDTAEITDNYFHDSYSGVLAIAKNIIVSRNLFRDMKVNAIHTPVDSDATYMQNIEISGNVIDGIGENLAGSAFGIQAVGSAKHDDYGVIISNNIIRNIHCYSGQSRNAIRASYTVVRGNVIGDNIGGSSEYQSAINVQSDSLSGGTDRLSCVIEGNIIQRSQSTADKWYYGISVQTDVDEPVIVKNNFVESGATYNADLYDLYGSAIISGNSFPGGIQRISTFVTPIGVEARSVYDYDISTWLGIDDGDTTPSVAYKRLLHTQNTNPTTITYFDDGYNGQEFIVVFYDINTTIDFTGSNMYGNNGSDWTPNLYNMMRCVKFGTLWLCDIIDTR